MDCITIDGKSFKMCSQPLSEYLKVCAPSLQFKVCGSFNWRGYVAEWMLQDDGLYLTNVHGDLLNGPPIAVSDLFPFADGPVPALWCCEILQVLIEDRQNAVRGWGYRCEYQREMLITIQSGKVTNVVEQDIQMD